MHKINITKLSDLAVLPQQMSTQAAGYDLYSANESEIIIEPGAVSLIPTGLAISLPEGLEAQIRPRSGLALNHQIGVLNSPGTIDPDYRGEIKVIAFNFGKNAFTVKTGTRIAQMVISKYEQVEFCEVDQLDSTSRGEGGFGHTKH